LAVKSTTHVAWKPGNKLLGGNISPLNFAKTSKEWKQQNQPENIGYTF